METKKSITGLSLLFISVMIACFMATFNKQERNSLYTRQVLRLIERTFRLQSTWGEQSSSKPQM